MSRRHILVQVFSGAAVLLLGGMAGWQWHHTSGKEYRLRRGQEAARRGDTSNAERFALRLEAAGDLNHARLLRGEIALRGDDLPEAIAQYNQLRGSGDIRVEASALYGRWFLLHLQRPVEAERFLRSVVAERPDHVDAHRGLASIYYDQGAWALAVGHLERWGQLDAKDGRPYRLMALIYRDLEQPQLAVPCYREALRRRLKDFVVREVQFELAECLARQAKYADALEALAAVPEDAGETSAIIVRAESLWGLGRSAEARAAVDAAFARHPECAELLLLKARMHLTEGSAAAAVPLLEAALRTNPHDSASRYQLTQALEGLGRRQEAVEQRRLLQETQVLMLERSRLTLEAGEKPWDAAVRRRLADVCDRLRMADASALWRRSAERCPPTQVADEVKASP